MVGAPTVMRKPCCVLVNNDRCGIRGSKYRWERRNLLVAVRAEVLLSIVDCHSTINGSRQSSVLHDRDLLEGAVLVPEKHRRSPTTQN